MTFGEMASRCALDADFQVRVLEGQLRGENVGNLEERIARRHLKKIAGDLWYHLTDKSKFKLDPKFSPADNTIALEDRSGIPGLYLGKSVEAWVNGYNYWRPFVVEVEVDPSVKDDPGFGGRWGGEIFVPSNSYGKLSITRVIPLDAYAREKYGSFGWVEEVVKRRFDTGEPIPPGFRGYPFRGYRYPGPDVRSMSSEDLTRLKRDLREARKFL